MVFDTSVEMRAGSVFPLDESSRRKFWIKLTRHKISKIY